MSSTEQPDVQETELDRLSSRASETLSQHTPKLIIGGIVLVTLIAIVAVTTGGPNLKGAEGWSAFAAAASAEDFSNVAADYSDDDVAIWARLREGEILLREAVNLQFTSRTEAEGELRKARESFDSVLKNSKLKDNPEKWVSARERALLGKARLLEAASNGDTSEAVAAYKDLLQKYEGSIYEESLKARVASLESAEAVAFYKWFDKQNPKREDRAKPRDGMPAGLDGMPMGHPEVEVTLPSIPDELIPPNWSDLDDAANAAEIPVKSDGSAADSDSEDAPDAPADESEDKETSSDTTPDESSKSE